MLSARFGAPSEAALLAAEPAPTAFGPLRLVKGPAAATAVAVALLFAAVVVTAVEVVSGEVVAAVTIAAWVASTEVVASSVGRRPAEITPLAGRTGPVFRNIQAQRAPCELAPMELLNGLLGVLFRGKPDESKASGAACFPVLWNVNVHDLTNLTEELAKLFVRRGKVQVPYEYLV